MITQRLNALVCFLISSVLRAVMQVHLKWSTTEAIVRKQISTMLPHSETMIYTEIGLHFLCSSVCHRLEEKWNSSAGFWLGMPDA